MRAQEEDWHNYRQKHSQMASKCLTKIRCRALILEQALSGPLDDRSLGILTSLEKKVVRETLLVFTPDLAMMFAPRC